MGTRGSAQSGGLAAIVPSVYVLSTLDPAQQTARRRRRRREGRHPASLLPRSRLRPDAVCGE